MTNEPVLGRERGIKKIIHPGISKMENAHAYCAIVKWYSNIPVVFFIKINDGIFMFFNFKLLNLQNSRQENKFILKQMSKGFFCILLQV